MNMIKAEGLTADLYYDRDPPFTFSTHDYRLWCEYVSPHEYRIHVHISHASSHPLRVMVEKEGDPDFTHIVDISMEDASGPCPKGQGWCCTKTCRTTTVVEPLREEEGVGFDASWSFSSWDPIPPLQRLTRTEFNHVFQTDVVALPTSLFAFGVSLENVYYYHEGDGVHGREYYNIEAPILHLVQAARSVMSDGVSCTGLPIYFVVASTDGFLEQSPWSPQRVRPRHYTYQECVGSYLPPALADDEYPVFHSRKTVWVQSAHVGLPHVQCIPDRHYFYHNRYHPFRSFHRGIPFREKVPKIVYAGQDRDTVHNFMDAGVGEGLTPRNYFKQVVAPKHPFIHCNGSWIDRRDMPMFKYILDIDGAASTWDATAWKLNSGSVILKPRSTWRQWFYDPNPPSALRSKDLVVEGLQPSDKYVPGVHFVEIANDFSDIEDVFAWCESHPDACEAMIRQCRDLFQQVYSYTNVCRFTKEVIGAHFAGRSAGRSAIHQHIDWVVYINLNHRRDRRVAIEQQLDAYGIAYDRFTAFRRDPGIVGCTMSHLAVYRAAKERGVTNVWILEDDLQFLVSRTELETHVAHLFTKSFDVAMLAYNLLESEDISEDTDCDPATTRVLCAQTASCYIVQAHYLERLIELYERTLPLLEQTGEHWKYANDQSWKELQRRDQWIAPKKRLGKQSDGYSDNAQEFMSYGM